MMSPYEMEFMADERVREMHEAAATRWLLRSTAPTRAAGPALRTRFVDRLARVTMRRAEAR